jgi:hypothetical protein
MKLLFFLRTLACSLFKENNSPPRKGTLTLISVFIFFLFSTLGLGMLYLTQVYLKTSAYRRNSILCGYASENGIKQGFDQFHRLLLERSELMLLTEGETLDFFQDAENGGTGIIEQALGCSLPLVSMDHWERMSWESLTDFTLERLVDEEDYFRVQYKGEISATGKLEHFKSRKNARLDSKLDILAGHIPLPLVPVLVDKEMNPEEKSHFLKESQIDILPLEQNELPVPIAFSEKNLIPEQAFSQLAEALKIKIFHPQDLSASKLREVLGLEQGKEPVPDGVYLIEDNLGLGGVFVQGDLDEMVLAIQENFQVIKFVSEQGIWILKFSPQESKTVFRTPSEMQSYQFIPRGIIIVNGKIHSLGGGYVDSEEKIVMSREQELPCILRGVNLKIISSDEINLSSHLIYQGLKWEEGVPYVKDSDTQLSIFSTGKDFLESTEKNGQINISADAPDELKLQASLTASNRGINVLGEKKKIQVLGSLQAADFVLNDNEISVKFDERFFTPGDLLQHSPKTRNPVLFISCFMIIGWKEF